MAEHTKISRKRRHEAMLEQGMHSGNTDAKFDPPPAPIKLKSKDGCAECEVPEKYVAALIASGKWVRMPGDVSKVTEGRNAP